jgi:hypothetical protein
MFLPFSLDREAEIILFSLGLLAVLLVSYTRTHTEPPPKKSVPHLSCTRTYTAPPTTTKLLKPVTCSYPCNGIIESAGILLFQFIEPEKKMTIVLTGTMGDSMFICSEPGGIINVNAKGYPIETVKQAAVRETKEETSGLVDLNIDCLDNGILIPQLARLGYFYKFFPFLLASSFSCRDFFNQDVISLRKSHIHSGNRAWGETDILLRMYVEKIDWGTTGYPPRLQYVDNFGTPMQVILTDRTRECLHASKMYFM